jgi:hypothetical protein
MHEGQADQGGGRRVGRDVGAGRNAVKPEQLVKQAQPQRRGQVALTGGGPDQPDDQGAFQQGGVYEEAERGKEDKKKATPKT